MKETEEETLHRYFDLIQNELDDFPTFENILKACKFYHQERLKSSLPSEEEISSIVDNYRKKQIQNDEFSAFDYKCGFKDALTLLTKGDR